MKKILLIALPLLLIVGCSKVEGQQLISRVEIGERGKIEITYYKKTQNRIEKVKYERYYENGQKEREGTVKDGKYDGLVTSWYRNGQKEVERNYKNGNRISSKKWNSDGSVKQ